MMLYAGCSRCRSIIPLYCAGQFMPHGPVPLQAARTGPHCAWCGPIPPVFTCMNCGTFQGLYLPGMGAPPAGARLLAPVVQARSQPSSSWFAGAAKDMLREAMSSFSQQFGQNAANSMGAWTC
jgi:hypothetical protein